MMPTASQIAEVLRLYEAGNALKVIYVDAGLTRNQVDKILRKHLEAHRDQEVISLTAAIRSKLDAGIMRFKVPKSSRVTRMQVFDTLRAEYDITLTKQGHRFSRR